MRINFDILQGTILKMRLWIVTITIIITSFSSPSFAIEAYDAFINKVNVPNKMIVGRTYTTEVSVKNTGSAIWSQENRISLSLTNASNKDWNVKKPILLKKGEVIKPGDSKVFSFRLKAIPNTGVYTLQFEMRQAGKTFGQQSIPTNVVVETRNNRVGFVSQLMPNTMNAGQKYSVVVQLKNEGTINWTRAEGYQLGLKSKRSGWKLSQVRLEKNDIIAPGEIATFRFELEAPNKPGFYDIQWQMQRWARWFGEPTPKQQINIVESSSLSGAEFVYQKVPGMKQGNQLYAIVKRGDIVPVNVTFKNTSDQVWTEGHYSLNSQNPANNLVWSLDRIELKSGEAIKSGQIKTFNFKIIAPLEPGIYHFQWQMVKGFNSWIGEKSENVVITVK